MIKKANAVLRSLNTRYVIIGGIAASLHGRPRMTMDSDIVVLLANDRIVDFLQSMKEHGFSVSASSLPKIAARLEHRLPIKLRYRKRYSVDVRLASYTIDYNAIRRAKRQFLFDVELPIATPEDLIVYKLARFDGIDQSDIKAVAVRHPRTLGGRYVREATKKLVEETGNKEIETHLAAALSWLKS